MLDYIIRDVKLNLPDYEINLTPSNPIFNLGCMCTCATLGALAHISAFPFKIPVDILSQKNPDIYCHILKYCKTKGFRNEAELYNSAMVTRSVFSKIRNMRDTGYRPSKATIIKLCIALQLSFEETLNMLSILGYTLSNQITADKVIAYIMTDVPLYAKGKLSVWDFCNALEELTGSTYLLEG